MAPVKVTASALRVAKVEASRVKRFVCMMNSSFVGIEALPTLHRCRSARTCVHAWSVCRWRPGRARGWCGVIGAEREALGRAEQPSRGIGDPCAKETQQALANGTVGSIGSRFLFHRLREFEMSSISERERREIEAANASGNTPVVFIHGLWLLPSSWANWVEFFKQAGYAPLTPDWPDDPETVEEARANPDVFAKKTLGQIAEHTTEVIKALDHKPIIMGHSTGGLLAQMLAGQGLAAATVAIDPGVFRGVLPLPASVLKGVGPFLLNPLTRGRAITLTFDQFKFGWTNALDEQESKELYDTFHVAGSGIALVQMGNANLNPWTEAKVDTKNPDRGPLLIIDGEKDHTVPWAIANAAYKRQKRNAAVTEIVKIPNRGHSLTIDHGWREVAQTALDFVKRFS